jgi:hypothetical protein
MAFSVPDLTPIDVFLWGHLKVHFYSVPPRTVEDIVQDIRQPKLTSQDVFVRMP